MLLVRSTIAFFNINRCQVVSIGWNVKGVVFSNICAVDC